MLKANRLLLVSLILVGLLLSACGQAAEEPKPAAELKDVRIAVGTYVLNIGYPWLMVPQAAGFWRDLGYNVTVEGVGASLDCVQQLVGGNVDFVQVNSTVVIQSNVKESIPLRIVHETGTVDWGLVVPADSDITDVQDFRGKDIGVFSLASGGIPLMQAYLSSEGVGTDEYEMIPVGFGPQASDALNRGDVVALMLWNSALAQLENLGHEFRYFRPEMWTTMPDFSLATMVGMIERDRQTVVDIVKGIAMAEVFTQANPECVVKLQWDNWPDTKPADVDDETAKAWDMHILEAQFNVAMLGAFNLHGGDLWGVATPEEYGRLQEFMLNAGLIEDTLDPATFIIDSPGFWEEVNDFDHEAIIELAQKCDY